MTPTTEMGQLTGSTSSNTANPLTIASLNTSLIFTSEESTVQTQHAGDKRKRQDNSTPHNNTESPAENISTASTSTVIQSGTTNTGGNLNTITGNINSAVTQDTLVNLTEQKIKESDTKRTKMTPSTHSPSASASASASGSNSHHKYYASGFSTTSASASASTSSSGSNSAGGTASLHLASVQNSSVTLPLKNHSKIKTDFLFQNRVSINLEKNSLLNELINLGIQIITSKKSGDSSEQIAKNFLNQFKTLLLKTIKVKAVPIPEFLPAHAIPLFASESAPMFASMFASKSTSFFDRPFIFVDEDIDEDSEFFSEQKFINTLTAEELISAVDIPESIILNLTIKDGPDIKPDVISETTKQIAFLIIFRALILTPEIDPVIILIILQELGTSLTFNSPNQKEKLDSNNKLIFIKQLLDSQEMRAILEDENLLSVIFRNDGYRLASILMHHSLINLDNLYSVELFKYIETLAENAIAEKTNDNPFEYAERASIYLCYIAFLTKTLKHNIEIYKQETKNPNPTISKNSTKKTLEITAPNEKTAIHNRAQKTLTYIKMINMSSLSYTNFNFRILHTIEYLAKDLCSIISNHNSLFSLDLHLSAIYEYNKISMYYDPENNPNPEHKELNEALLRSVSQKATLTFSQAKQLTMISLQWTYKNKNESGKYENRSYFPNIAHFWDANNTFLNLFAKRDFFLKTQEYCLKNKLNFFPEPLSNLIYEYFEFLSDTFSPILPSGDKYMWDEDRNKDNDTLVILNQIDALSNAIRHVSKMKKIENPSEANTNPKKPVLFSRYLPELTIENIFKQFAECFCSLNPQHYTEHSNLPQFGFYFSDSSTELVCRSYTENCPQAPYEYVCVAHSDKKISFENRATASKAYPNEARFFEMDSLFAELTLIHEEEKKDNKRYINGFLRDEIEEENCDEPLIFLSYKNKLLTLLNVFNDHILHLNQIPPDMVLPATQFRQKASSLIFSYKSNTSKPSISESDASESDISEQLETESENDSAKPTLQKPENEDKPGSRSGSGGGMALG